MRYSLSFVVAMAASVLAADPIVVNTPASAVQCQNTIVTWTGGVPPFQMAIVHDQTAEHFDSLTERTFTWNTNLPANTNLFFFVTDSTSNSAQSNQINVQPSSDNTCLQQ